jgi:hypothetical protein
MNNASIIVKFEHNILSVRFLENAKIEVEDVKEIYEYGNMWAHGKPYGIIFEPTGHYKLSEDAVEYISVSNPSDSHIIAKAYVINDKESKIKIELHMQFDKPALRPNIFTNHADARKFIEAAIKVDKNN